jgi:hypothetical protein
MLKWNGFLEFDPLSLATPQIKNKIKKKIHFPSYFHMSNKNINLHPPPPQQ